MCTFGVTNNGVLEVGILAIIRGKVYCEECFTGLANRLGISKEELFCREGGRCRGCKKIIKSPVWGFGPGVDLKDDVTEFDSMPVFVGDEAYCVECMQREHAEKEQLSH